MPEISNDTVYAKAVARAWSDNVFRTQLLNDPKKVLTEEGMSIPDWMDVSVTENRAHSSVVFYLPPKPEGLSTSSLTDAAFRAATKYATSDTDTNPPPPPSDTDDGNGDTDDGNGDTDDPPPTDDGSKCTAPKNCS